MAGGAVSVKFVVDSAEALSKIEAHKNAAKRISDDTTQKLAANAAMSSKILNQAFGSTANVVVGAFAGFGAAAALGVKAMREYANESERAAGQLAEIESTWSRILADTGEDIFNIGGPNPGSDASGILKDVAKALDFYTSLTATQWKVYGIISKNLSLFSLTNTLLTGGLAGVGDQLSNTVDDLIEVGPDGGDSPFKSAENKAERRRLAERQRLKEALLEQQQMTLRANDETAKALFEADEWGRTQKARVNREIKSEADNPEAVAERARLFAAIDVEVMRRRASALEAADQRRRDAARKEGEAQDKAWEQHQDLLEQLQMERDQKKDYLQLLEQEAKIAGLIAAGKDKEAKQAGLEFERQKELNKLRGMDLTYAERKAAIENINGRFDADIAGLNKPEQDKGGSQAFGFSGGTRGLAARVFAQPGTSTAVMDENRKQTRLLEEIRNNTKSNGVSRFAP